MAIRHKRKATTGYTWQSADLVSGQIGVNTADGTLHVKKDDNSVVTVGSGSSATEWGDITGTLSDQTDLNTALSGKVSTSVVDAKGDLLVGTADNTVAKLAVGTNGYVLTADSAEVSGVKWAAASGGSSPEYIKQPVRGATTANLASLSGNLTVDGLTTAAGDRILVKNQTTASQNGIYIASASAWTRATDFDTGAYISNGCVIPVAFGTVNGGSTWQLVQNGGTIGNNFRFAPLNGIAAYGQAVWTTPIVSGENAIAIGNDSQATGTGNVAIGRYARATTSGSIVCLGPVTQSTGASSINISSNGNSNSGASAVIIGKGMNQANSGMNTIGLGFVNALSNFSFVVDPYGGMHTTSGFDYNTVLGGRGAYTTSEGGWVYANTAYTGNCQAERYVPNIKTTNATKTYLTNTSSSGKYCIVKAGSNRGSQGFIITVVARQTGGTAGAVGDSKFWKIEGLVKNVSGTISFVGTPTVTVIAADTNASAWLADVETHTSEQWRIAVTGEADKNITWVTEVTLTAAYG